MHCIVLQCTVRVAKAAALQDDSLVAWLEYIDVGGRAIKQRQIQTAITEMRMVSHIWSLQLVLPAETAMAADHQVRPAFVCV